VSIEIMAEVWKHAPCRGGELLFVLALADQAGDEDRCAWPGMKMLMERTRSSRRSVYNYADTLQRQQVIEQITPEEAPKRWRPSRHGGHETTLWRIRPVEEWLDADADSHHTGAESAPQGSSTSTGRGATSAQVGCNPLHQNQQEPPDRKNNSTATQQSRSSRHASRARDDSGWDDPAARVFAKDQEPDDSEPGERPRTARSHGPDSAWALNGYYRQAVFVAGTGRVGNTNDGAMRKFFAEARRCGVRPATLRAMVDCFVEDPQLFNRTRTHRWKVFIANAPMLQERANNIIGVAPMEAGKEQFGGAIPKKVLDEILAEAG
jgi:hypothetical protein